jgi:GNAT superfamily N-acetyltransferase
VSLASRVAPLFTGRNELPAVVEAALEGRLGRVAAGEGAARLSIGCYEMFGGEAESAGAQPLVETAARPRELVYGRDPEWRRLILDVHGERVRDRPMREFDPSALDRGELARLETGLPHGFELRRLDLALAQQLDTELEPHGLQVFENPAHLVASGLGFGAVDAGRLACAATSYTRSSRYVEVAIATRPAYRNLGLAAAVAAALLRHCLQNGLIPCWSASNPVSQRLAARLGYRPAGVCEVLYLS